MGMKTKIVTHPGKAHRDDFLSCCLLVYHLYADGPAVIERRTAVAEDLVDKNTWVVDTGKQYQPHFSNFDHHQETAEVRGRCALDLVCDHIFTKEDIRLARDIFPWLKVSTIHDCYGPNATADMLGITSFQYMMCSSPVEKWMLELFSRLTCIEVTSTAYTVMLEIGRSLYNSVIKLSQQQTSIDNIPPPKDLNKRLKWWDVRGNYCDGTTESKTLLNQRAKDLGVNIVVNHSTRSDGPSIYVLPRSIHEFSTNLIENDPQVFYSHKNGHFAIFKRGISHDRLLQLLQQCMVNPIDNPSHTTPKTRHKGRPKKNK